MARSHNSTSTMFDRWCGILLFMRCFSPSPCFYIILVQVSLGFICWFLTQLNLTSLLLSVTSGLNFVINPVFDFVKASLDCRLWQWYTCLLKSVLGLTRCCKGFLMELQRNRPRLSMKLFFLSQFIAFETLNWSLKFTLQSLLDCLIYYPLWCLIK